MEPIPATDPPSARPRPRGWRRLIPRLSLRGMIVLVLLVGGGLGWYVRGVKAQRDAAAAIRAAGGRVYYAGEWDHANDRPLAPAAARPAAPGWLVRWLGADAFLRVEAVWLQGDAWGGHSDDRLLEQVGRLDRLSYLNLDGCRKVTNAGFAHLGNLADLRSLRFVDTGADLAALRYLAGMTRLVRIGLPRVPVADADLVHLAGLAELEILADWSCERVTDAGLAHLRGLTRLKILDLSRARVTSAGLAALRGMDRLERLDLTATAVSDLAPIAHLERLRRLDLDSTPIGDAGLAPIEAIRGLEELILPYTGVTDAGLDHLRGLKQMKVLNLAGTKLTDAGMADLAALPWMSRLNLNRTGVGDAGLDRLAGLGELTSLSLVETRVTDAGLAGLRGLGRCETLWVGGPAITDAGLARIRKARPRCFIERRILD